MAPNPTSNIQQVDLERAPLLSDLVSVTILCDSSRQEKMVNLTSHNLNRKWKFQKKDFFDFQDESKTQPTGKSKANDLKSRKMTYNAMSQLTVFALAELIGGMTFSLLAPFYTKEATAKGLSVSETGLV